MATVSRDVAEAVIRLVGEDQVREIIQGTNKDLDETAKRTRRVNDESVDLGKRWEALGDKLDGIRRSAGLLAAQELAGMVADATRAVAEVAREGARELAVSADFERRFRGQAGALDALRSASQGLVDDGALRALATETQRAGMSLEQTTQLLQVAARAAVGTGQDAAEMARELAELSRGTADEVEEGLKRLGLVVDTSAAQARYAASLGLTTSQLTRQQQAAASLDTVLREVGSAFGQVTGDEAAARVSRLDAAWSNFTSRLKAETVQAVSELVDMPSAVHSALGAVMAAALPHVRQQQEAAKAAADLAAEEAALTAVFAERQRHYDALALAEAKRLAGLRAEVLGITDAMAAEAEHSRAVALMAEALGESSVAGQQWLTVLDQLGAAHIAAADDVQALYGAVRNSNNEMARALELQAEMAAAAGDAAGADALRAQALGALTAGSQSAQRPATRGGGGGRARQADSDLGGALEQDLAAMREQIAQGMADMRDAARGFDDLIAEQRNRAEADAYAEQLQAYQDQQAARIESMRIGMDSLRDSTLALRDALGEVGGVDLGGLAEAFGGLDELAAQWAAVGDAAGKSGNAMAVGALGAAAATGRMVAGVIKDQRAQAVVMALVEQAEAWASFGRMDYVGFGAHLASSALWGVVAGKGSSGGGGGGGSRGSRSPGAVGRIPGDTGQQARQETPAQPITVHVSGGTYLGTRHTETGRELGAMVSDAAARGTRDPSRARGPG